MTTNKMPDAYLHECRYGDEIFISKDFAERRKSMCGGEIIPLYRADSPSPATVEKIREVRKHAVELWHKCVNDVEPNRLSNEMDTICDRLIDKIDEALAAHEAEGEK